jgi:hypothetical protein
MWNVHAPTVWLGRGGHTETKILAVEFYFNMYRCLLSCFFSFRSKLLLKYLLECKKQQVGQEFRKDAGLRVPFGILLRWQGGGGGQPLFLPHTVVRQPHPQHRQVLNFERTYSSNNFLLFSVSNIFIFLNT